MTSYAVVASKVNNDPITQTDWGNVAGDLQLHQDVQTVRPLNNTGGTITAGYVGVLDDAAIDTLIAASMAGDARKVVVVQDVSVLNGALAYCQMLGRCSVVKVQGAVALHDPLETHSTAGYAHTGTGAPFGIALSTAAGPGAGTVVALLIPLMAGGSFPTGIPSATHGPVSFHNTVTTLVTGVIAAPGAGKSIYITRIRLGQNNTTASLYDVKDATPNHTESYPLAGVQGYGVVDEFDPPWKVGDNLALNMQQSAAADVYGSINHYVAAS